VAREHGVAETARALQLDRERLERLVSVGRLDAPLRAAGAMEFVELGALGWNEGRGRVVLELVGREGDRARLEVNGEATSVDVVEFARTFWRRGT
jgi:hypothetical protein